MVLWMFIFRLNGSVPVLRKGKGPPGCRQWSCRRQAQIAPPSAVALKGEVHGAGVWEVGHVPV